MGQLALKESFTCILNSLPVIAPPGFIALAICFGQVFLVNVHFRVAPYVMQTR